VNKVIVALITAILGLASAFCLTYASEVRLEAQLVEIEIERNQLNCWARSGVEFVKLELDQLARPEDLGSKDGWTASFGSNPLYIGSGKIEIGTYSKLRNERTWISGVVDEDKKIPLRWNDMIMLESIPELSASAVRFLSRKQTELGNGALSPFWLFGELKATDALVAEEYISRYSQSVNVNTASRSTLIAVGVPED